MIDSKFIIKYTNALYATPAEFAPRYDEFRDMFSLGQIQSKEWLVNSLKEEIDLEDKSILIVGSWFGTLGSMLLSETESAKIAFLDIDPRCEKYLHNIYWNDTRVRLITGDMYKHHYSENIVINTSCEHIPDLKAWLDLLPKGTIVALQSNNYDSVPEHINCVYSECDFIKKANLSEVIMFGEHYMPMYSRYMIIGRT